MATEDSFYLVRLIAIKPDDNFLTDDMKVFLRIGEIFINNNSVANKLFTRFSIGVDAVWGPFPCCFCC